MPLTESQRLHLERRLREERARANDALDRALDGWSLADGRDRAGDLTDALARLTPNLADRIRADGSLAFGPHQGSIHKVGAGLNKAPSCNGWTFWHVERKGRLLPLDTLRQEHLAGLE